MNAIEPTIPMDLSEFKEKFEKLVDSLNYLMANQSLEDVLMQLFSSVQMNGLDALIRELEQLLNTDLPIETLLKQLFGMNMDM